MHVESEIELVSLRSGRDLSRIGIDTRLTAGPSTDYPVTRQWSATIRSWSDQAQGITWRSGREPDGFVYLFFGDRTGSDGIATANSACGEEAFWQISLILGEYGVAVSGPE